MTEGENQQPLPPQNYRPSTEDLRRARTARNLTMFASIAGPVSLIIGGVVLSGAGLVCGFIAWRKLKFLATRETEVAKAAAQLRRPCIASLVMCGIAFVINAIFFYFNFTALLGMMESGEFAELVAGAGSSAAGTSTWG